MRTCPACGASAPPHASWCGQCYGALPGAAPALAAPALAAPALAAPALAAVGAAPAQAEPQSWHPGWAPPAPLPNQTAQPGQPAQPTAGEPAPRVSRHAVLVTAIAIGVGAIAMGVSSILAQDSSLSIATYIRYAMVITLAVYAVVGVLVATQVAHHARLRWTDGQPALGVAIGLLVGGGLAATMLVLVSAAVGHLDPDPRVVMLMSEGDAPHIVATILLTCIAAPLVEEILFRGLLLESLRHRGVAPAVWLSALAFAVWHLTPSALRYYALLGALLGYLYSRRGLACSMAAHFGFNSVLTLAALSVVLTPGPSLNAAGLTAQLPGGWRAVSAAEMPSGFGAVVPAAAFRGPSDAHLMVTTIATPVAPDVDRIISSIDATASLPGLNRASVHQLQLDPGPAVEADAVVDGQALTVVVLPHIGTSYEFLFQGSGSAKAAADFQRILRDLRLS